MTEAQYLTLILGFVTTIVTTIGAVMMALLVNNARLNDVKEALRAEIDAKAAGILAQMATYPDGHHLQDCRAR